MSLPYLYIKLNRELKAANKQTNRGLGRISATFRVTEKDLKIIRKELKKLGF